MISSKLWSGVAPVWYSTKLHVTCIKGSKPFRETLKIRLCGRSKNPF